MTDIIELARRAGAVRLEQVLATERDQVYAVSNLAIERFAALVAEQCAKECDKVSDATPDELPENWTNGYWAALSAALCADGIRSKYCKGE